MAYMKGWLFFAGVDISKKRLEPFGGRRVCQSHAHDVYDSHHLLLLFSKKSNVITEMGKEEG